MSSRQWSQWASLGRPPVADSEAPLVHRNEDGRLEVFSLADGRIFNIWQVSPNVGWNEHWAEKGRPSSNVSIKSFVVGGNQDGHLEIFGTAEDGNVWHIWQTAPNNGWSNWQTLGSPSGGISPTEKPVVGQNEDGRQELFLRGSDGNIWHIWQTAANGGWSHWESRGQPPTRIRSVDRITVGRNQDGRQELFVMGQDEALWHIWQVGPNIEWGHWESLGKPTDVFDGTEPPKQRRLSNPLVEINADGHLEVFAPGDGAFCNRWQEKWRDGPDKVSWRAKGWNEKAKPRPDVELTWLDAALNSRDRLEILGFGNDRALWHSWQVDVAPFWSKWETLGAPSPGIREAERLAIGVNQDRRLEAFIVGQDGAVWHTWEMP